MTSRIAGRARLGVSALALLAAMPIASRAQMAPNLVEQLQQQGQNPTLNSLETWTRNDETPPMPYYSTTVSLGPFDWDSDKGEPIPMFATMTATGQIDWDSDKGEPIAMYTSPVIPEERYNLVDLLTTRGHEVTIQNIIPLMNWRDNLGAPGGQYDNTNTRPTVAMVNMVRADTSASMGYCSGTLINARFFLTAAHCVRDGVTPAALVRAGINFSPATGGVFTGPSNRQAVSIVTP